MSAIRHLQISAGFQDPFGPGTFPRLEYVLKGIRRAPQTVPTRPRLPITPTILRSFHALWSREQNPDYQMLWAACCLGFFGFLRSGEFTVHSASGSSVRNPAPLLLSDIALDSIQRPTVVSVRICQSKTDPFRLGVTLYLGITRDIVCPVKSMAAYLAVRSREQGPLFLYQDGSPLTRGRLVVVVREALSQMGLDSSNYAGHSFRIGAATTAAQVGIPESTIQMLGRWQSSAYARYIRTPRQDLATLSSVLVGNI